jgi:hypothetical protein
VGWRGATELIPSLPEDPRAALTVVAGASPKNYFVGAGHSVSWAITSGLLPTAAYVILAFCSSSPGSSSSPLAASSGHRGVLIASILSALFILGAAFNGPASSTSTTAPSR